IAVALVYFGAWQPFRVMLGCLLFSMVNALQLWIQTLGIPIKLGQDTIGAFSVDRLFKEDISFEENIRLLEMISSMVAQAVQIFRMREKEKEQLVCENIELKRELKGRYHPKNIVGESKRMRDVYASIDLVSQTRAAVMLRGENGTGKELIAHAIHYSSGQADGPFVKISCATLPDILLESELFGYEKGAFAGAIATKKGRFEMACRGTLFLDEIGDISLSTQVKLLKVLQEKEFVRLGGTETIRTDFRLITATHKDLEKEVREGRFRADLYYRMNAMSIFVPPLRDRKEDIPLLVDCFLKKACQENRKDIRFVTDEAMQYLMSYSWPGNVRELENAIERAVVLCPGEILVPSLFPIPGNEQGPVLTGFNPPEPFSSLDPEESASLPDVVKKLEIERIEKAIQQTHGNQRKAAKLLGITERMLGYKMKIYNLSRKSG
ncbi:MAG: sigma 54-interacting transcriptional regulator, partial [Candidatus Omnitrophica bacterium]|nr:sigma 54-interacting transcriptional regulator [Candidatus Omnitrophota bacterium]